MEIFVEVVAAGSFSAVARQRRVEPSTISRAVATLEAELGVRLLERSTRRLQPTQAGERYLARVRDPLAALASAAEEVRDTQGSSAGRLRVTASVAFGHECLVPGLPALVAEHPQLQLDLLLTDAAVDLVAERVDLALRLGSPRSPALPGTAVVTPLWRVAYAVYASPGWVEHFGEVADPRALADVDCLRQPLAGYEERWRFRPFDAAEGTRTIDVPVHGPLTMSNPLALRRAAEQGLGPALLADWLAAPAVRAGRLQRVVQGWHASAGDFDGAVLALRPSRRYEPAVVRAFVDWLRGPQVAGGQALSQ